MNANQAIDAGGGPDDPSPGESPGESPAILPAVPPARVNLLDVRAELDAGEDKVRAVLYLQSEARLPLNPVSLSIGDAREMRDCLNDVLAGHDRDPGE